VGDRCTGRCCQEIRLGWSPEEILLAADAATRGDAYYVWHNDAYVAIGDSIKLHEMLTPVGQEADGKWLYHCRHLLPSGDCDDYENRPWMCSAFPYGQKCPYPDCQWDEARHAT
jgi:Fe-S-cluster containining protein